MEDIEQFMLFLAAAVLLNVSPGSDHVYILSRTIAQGYKTGFLSSWGVCTGAMIHVIAAAAGVSAIIATSETAFLAVKLIGAGYLVWLGIQALRSRGMSFRVDTLQAKPASGYQTFRQGVLVDLFNPKVAVFFIAFLPQFVDPYKGAAWWQMITLGIIIILIALIWEAVLIVGADFISRKIRDNDAVGKWLDRTLGVVFISLGISLVFSN
ncbi:LysE family translocator [Marinobacter sp. AC-23]|uniref:LysE family translocator n=1 Tax=Marinobacter sp. AC-23 TaxID=1879031 RepID=UPI0008DD8993|nr:LysE family translocator [Marinobacter sp. AC-23]OHY79318.1 lysine transporter LysE [Marinobacter sp. AC-23]